jgi:hypothetical protein
MNTKQKIVLVFAAIVLFGYGMALGYKLGMDNCNSISQSTKKYKP